MANNLYQKILAVSTEVKNVEKNTTVNAGKSSYKAVADFDVVLAVKAAEQKYGVVSIPVKQELVDSQVVTNTDQYGNQKSTFVDIIKMTVRIFDAENPSDYIEVESFGRGIDTGDKGFGKASTYARKYCLLNVYKIATGEDPDRDASPEGNHMEVAGNGANETQKFATIESVLAEIKKVRSKTSLDSIYNKYVNLYGGTPEFIQALNDKASKL